MCESRGGTKAIKLSEHRFPHAHSHSGLTGSDGRDLIYYYYFTGGAMAFSNERKSGAGA